MDARNAYRQPCGSLARALDSAAIDLADSIFGAVPDSLSDALAAEEHRRPAREHMGWPAGLPGRRYG